MENTKNITPQTLEKINAYSVKELSAEEVFAFEVILCDNDIDRDFEKFNDESLEKLGELFKGRTGIFDHNPKCENQYARIYDTEVCQYPEKKTADGNIYRTLKGYAYMVRTEENKDFIKQIEGGIKKEISVSCKVEKRICSICGADQNVNPCMHAKNQTYGGKMCYISLENPLDAYEWSFVAVPAQKNAGVVKKCYGTEITDKTQQENQKKEREKLQKEILALSYFTSPCQSAETVWNYVINLDIKSLKKLKENLNNQAEKKCRENFCTRENNLNCHKNDNDKCYKL